MVCNYLLHLVFLVSFILVLFAFLIGTFFKVQFKLFLLTFILIFCLKHKQMCSNFRRLTFKSFPQTKAMFPPYSHVNCLCRLMTKHSTCVTDSDKRVHLCFVLFYITVCVLNLIFNKIIIIIILTLKQAVLTTT